MIMQGVKEKILDGFEFKKHIDTAAELNPSDHITHHLLGRFCFEVSQVNANKIRKIYKICLHVGLKIATQ